MLSALHTISTYPFDLQNKIFAQYPLMKLGHVASVNSFADLLAPMALQALARMPAKGQGWVLTSPPLQGLPCGANLVCRAICSRLARSLPADQAPLLDLMEVRGPRIPFRDPADFAAYNDYSKYDVRQRQQFRLARDERAKYDLANFADRHAVFVNDINVTGTQIATITRILHRAGAKSIDMLMILNVEREIGRAFPQLENQINSSRITDVAEFTRFLRDVDYEPTGKLISRLMAHDPTEFAAIFAELRPPQRQVLHRAILQEGLYAGQLFREKLAVVERSMAGS